MKAYRLTLFLTILAFALVMLGAYTRLTHAGLGCPDWPGCYGKMIIPGESIDTGRASKLYPGKPIQETRAWVEMTHRYVAGSLGIALLGFLIFSITTRLKGKKVPVVLPLLLVLTVIFQALLGMWTVTLQLLPQVVMGHLLGGMTLVSLLWLLTLSLKSPEVLNANHRFRKPVLIGLILVILQVALGGWVSSNYAGISCIGFPFCQGDWLSQLDFKQAFDFSMHLNQNFQGGVLDTAGRITIQMVHRLGALIVALFWGVLSVKLIRQGRGSVKHMGVIVLSLVICQVSLGIINVLYMLPFSIALLHNGMALLLLLAVITLVYLSYKTQQLRAI